MPGKPEGEINIEVVAPVISKPRGNSGEWTPPVIGEYDENFEGDDCDQSPRPFEFAARSIDRNGEDAANEEGPEDSVNCLYGLEPRHNSPMAQPEPWHQSEHYKQKEVDRTRDPVSATDVLGKGLTLESNCKPQLCADRKSQRKEPHY